MWVVIVAMIGIYANGRCRNFTPRLGVRSRLSTKTPWHGAGAFSSHGRTVLGEGDYLPFFFAGFAATLVVFLETGFFAAISGSSFLGKMDR
jgi:hypothetical protein